MAIDASIPLQVKQFQVDTPFQLAEGANQVNYGQQRNALIGEQILGQQQQHQVVGNQLRSAAILRDAASLPDSFTPDGMPSNALIARVASSGDVDAMNSMVSHAVSVQQKRALAEQEHAKSVKTQQETYEKYGKVIDEGMGKVRRYDDILKNAGMPDDQRQSAADAMWSKTLEDWDKSAAIDKATLARAPKTYSAPGFAASSEAYQKWDIEKQKAGNAGSKFTAPKWTDTKGLLYRPTQDGGLEVMDPTDNKWKGINQAPSDLMNLGVQSPTLVAEKAGKSAEARAEHPMPPSGYTNAPTAEDPTALKPRPGGPAEGRAPATPVTDAAIEAAAHQYIADKTMPSVGYGDRSTRQRILNKAADILIEQDRKPDALPGDRAAFKGLSSALGQLEAQRAKITTFENTAIHNADLALAASEAVDRTGSPAINRWLNAGKSEIAGDVPVAKLNLAMKTLINEYAKVTSSATGAGVTAQEEFNRMEKLINGAKTKEQVRDIVGLMKQEMRNRDKGYEEEVATLRGRMKEASTGSKVSSSANSAAKGAYDSPIPVTSDADYAAVPSGAYIKTPDGKIKGPKP